MGKGGKDNPTIGATFEIGQNGEYSRVFSGTPAINVFANGGIGAIKSTSLVYPQHLPGAGGNYNAVATTGITEYFTMPGQSGSPVSIEYFLLPANQYNEVVHFGNGGHAGNVPNSGANGGKLIKNINGAVTTTVMVSPPWQSRGGFPGGGGPGMPTGTLNSSRPGANGMVIIHY